MKTQKRLENLFNARLDFETEQKNHFVYQTRKNMDEKKDKMEANFVK